MNKEKLETSMRKRRKKIENDRKVWKKGGKEWKMRKRYEEK